MADLEEIRERLAALAEELADIALDRLRAAQADAGDDDAVAAAVAVERRITRARHSVERAVELLAPD